MINPLKFLLKFNKSRFARRSRRAGSHQGSDVSSANNIAATLEDSQLLSSTLQHYQISTIPLSSYPSNFTEFNGELYFSANSYRGGLHKINSAGVVTGWVAQTNLIKPLKTRHIITSWVPLALPVRCVVNAFLLQFLPRS